MSAQQDLSHQNLKQGLGLALITSFAWSTLGLCIKYAYDFIDAITLSGARFAFSAVALFVYFLFFDFKQLKDFKSVPRSIIWAGLGLACNYVGFAQGVMIANASTATVIAQLGPLLLALVGIFVFKDRISRTQAFGLTLAFAGFMIFYFEQLQSQSSSLALNQGTAWLIFGAITWTIWGYLNKKFSLAGFSVAKINFLVYVIAFLALSPVMNWQKLFQLNLSQFLFVLFLGANTLIAYGSLALAMKKAPVYMVSMMIALYPLMTIGLIQILDLLQISPIPAEPINSLGILGALCVVCGVVFTAKKT